MNLKILRCFATNLIHVCELIHYNFDHFFIWRYFITSFKSRLGVENNFS
jgi:hypothetical protein